MRRAIEQLRLTPILFELGARPHPPQALYRAYLEQSDVFVGIYAESYGWVAPGMETSGIEDEYRLAGTKPKLVYVKAAREREPRLQQFLAHISSDDVSYRPFESPEELADLLADDLALLVSERFVRRAAPAGLGHSSLPSPVSSFVGREREVEDVVELLLRDDIRLLTLTGPGGIGKTRLALECARRASPSFLDGVVFVPLAPVADHDDVASALAEALGVQEDSAGLFDLCCARVADLDLLLVLDNMEHLLPAAPLVGRLLTASPRLTVLATSRARLDVAGEHVFSVLPLGLPSVRTRDVAEIEGSEAVRLFATRARAFGWVAGDDDPPVVAEIVRWLDGLPLAIELAAAQVRLVPAGHVRTRLRRRLDLAGGPRDAEERHRTLRSTIGWSYELLDEAARNLFAALSVFVGGFTLQAAAAVGESGEDAEELLASLVDASLVTVGPSAVSGVRFGMLETIREFAAERLEESGRRSEVAARHLAHFARVADEGYAAAPEKRLSSRSWLSEERDNLRAALDQAMRTSPDEAVRLAGALGFLFSRRGLVREGSEAITNALDAAPSAPAEWRARALLQGGWLAVELDDHQTADRRAAEALELYRELEDERGVGASLNTLGYSAATRDDDERAIGFYEQAYETFSAAGLDLSRFYVAVNLAVVLSTQGRVDESRRLLREALEYFEQRGFEDEVATTLFRLGELESAAGDEAAARARFAACIALSRAVGNTRVLAWVLMRQAEIEAGSGHARAAADLFAEALELHLQIGDRQGAAFSLESLSAAAVALGQPEAAARLLGAARTQRVASTAPTPESEATAAAETVSAVEFEIGRERLEQEAALGEALGSSDVVRLVGEVLASYSS